MAGLASAGFVDQSLPDLCKCTFYKFILDNGHSDYPFVDVNGDRIRSNYTLTHKPGEKRTKIHRYLTALLAEASWVVIMIHTVSATGHQQSSFLKNFFPENR